MHKQMQLQRYLSLPVDEHTATSTMTEGDIMVLMYKLFNRQESGHGGAVESMG